MQVQQCSSRGRASSAAVEITSLASPWVLACSLTSAEWIVGRRAPHPISNPVLSAEGTSQPADLWISSLKVCSGRNSFCYSRTCRVQLDLKPLKHCISPAYVQSHSWKHWMCAHYFSTWMSESSENGGWLLSWNGLSVTWFSNVLSARLGACEVSERFWAFIALEMELKYGYMNFASCSCACKTLVLVLRMQDKKRIHLESPRKKIHEDVKRQTLVSEHYWILEFF